MLPPGGGGSPLTPAIWKAETGRTGGSVQGVQGQCGLQSRSRTGFKATEK